MAKRKKNIYHWLSENKVLYDINLNDDLQYVLKKTKKKKLKQAGEKNYGYYYFKNGYRFGYSDGVIDEIGIDFWQSKKFNWYIKKDDIKLELKNAKIHKVLNVLNELFIKWVPIKSHDRLALIIKIDKFPIYLIFDVYEGTLEKIASSNISNT